MKLAITFFILISNLGHGLAQIENQIYLHGRMWIDEMEILFVTVFEENNHYQNFQWNITTHAIGIPDDGKYYIINDTVSCQPSDFSQHSIEYVVDRVEGRKVLRLIAKEYNPDGSIAAIRMGSRPREELGKVLMEKWYQDIGKN